MHQYMFQLLDIKKQSTTNILVKIFVWVYVVTHLNTYR